MYKLKQTFLIPLLLISSSFYCFASETLIDDDIQNSPIERHWDLGFGVGFGNSSNPFAGADDIPNYLTLDLSIYGKRFFFDNGELGFTLIDKTNFGLNLITTYNTERIYYSYFNELGINLINTGNNLLFEDILVSELNPDSTISTGSFNPSPVIPSPLPPDFIEFPFGPVTLPLDVPKRNYALNLGIEALYDTPYGNLSLQFAHDISNTHNGFDLVADFGKNWQKNRWNFASHIGIHWKSSNLIDYYYGLDFNFHSLFELQYQGKSSLDKYINLRASYRLTNHVSFVASYKLNSFGSAIRNSPLITENSKNIFFTGLYYRF